MKHLFPFFALFLLVSCSSKADTQYNAANDRPIVTTIPASKDIIDNSIELSQFPDECSPNPWEQDYFWSFDTVAYCIPIDSHRKIEFTELIVFLAGEEKRCDTAYRKPRLIEGRDTISLSYDAEYEGAHIISPDKQKVAFLTRRCYWLGNVWIDREDCCILDLESKEFSFDKCGDGHFDNHNRWVCDGELMWVW